MVFPWSHLTDKVFCRIGFKKGFSAPLAFTLGNVILAICITFCSSISTTMGWNSYFLTFPACFSIPIIFSNLNSNCSNSLDIRNLQEQVKKAFCYQKLFWLFTVLINCSSDLKSFENYRPSASNFKSFLDHYNNLCKQWKVRTICGNRMLV